MTTEIVRPLCPKCGMHMINTGKEPPVFECLRCGHIDKPKNDAGLIDPEILGDLPGHQGVNIEIRTEQPRQPFAEPVKTNDPSAGGATGAVSENADVSGEILSKK